MAPSTKPNSSPSIWADRAWHKSLLVVVAYWFFLILIALIVPEDFEPKGSYGRFVEFFGNLVPTTNGLAEHSRMPGVVRGFLALAWAFYIPCAVIAFYFSPKRLRPEAEQRKWIFSFGVLAIFVVLVLGPLLFWNPEPDMSLKGGSAQTLMRIVYSGRLGLGGLFGLIMALSAFWVAATAFTIRALLTLDKK